MINIPTLWLGKLRFSKVQQYAQYNVSKRHRWDSGPGVSDLMCRPWTGYAAFPACIYWQ